MVNFVDIIVHLDKYLSALVGQYGPMIYLILFLIIFMETGFVVTPFLPGDSLLFTAGAIAALGALQLGILLPLLIIAAIAGDNLNYWIGFHVGPKIFNKEKSKWFNKKYLDKAHKFYEKYGIKTIIIARYIPIIRTFAPFVAGIARMTYWRFLLFDIIGGILWVSIFVLGGYYFGNLPFVKEHFSLVILAIMVISLIPAGLELWKHYKESKKEYKHQHQN